MPKSLLRNLAPVHEMIDDEEIQKYVRELGKELVTNLIREVQDKLRNDILEEKANIISFIKESKEDSDVQMYRLIKDELLERLDKKVESNFQQVINGTGTVLHTNLGRAPLSSEVMEKLSDTVTNYSNLEFDLDSGRRGSRYSHIESIIKDLTGAESAIVVNNNAAAVMLTLSALANDKEVIISRGELVEIGGSFRIPDVMKQSGAHLVEVGTTNKTHYSDYENAITDETGMLLKVHTSNYEIVGFTEGVSREELVQIGHDNGVYVVEDLGSGLLFDLSKYGLQYEPTINDVLKSGVDLVTFSGDKLLGGPQAGIIAGKKELVDKIKSNQLTRALRIDKLSLKALEETFRIYLNPEKAFKQIPVLYLLTQSLNDIEKRGKELKSKLESSVIKNSFHICLEKNVSRVGGGAMPTQDLETWTVVLKGDNSKLYDLWNSLREKNPPVISRLQNEKLIFDLRTIKEQELDTVVENLEACMTRE
ncbi:L-seryl-tRNA(Sec) selenium transferase [Natranaerobius trueperi]|uniref:L-seryl-tRNA(Sec) selenium transferase n=1 Tax=Natranaerobius trueperi TaxID=759412 RepID=A0A226BXS9_9FIRM|nr:L-seryl-tRNA(Sec) selenium transferase [Natranaerobius trueperi]OWZ83144.1 L-seryl-tRNA(Sec) selenium transferase [Natranaerobius trueperi]